MANLKQSKKRIRQNTKRFIRNRSNKSRIKTYIKRFLKLISLKETDKLIILYPKLISEIDKSVNRNIFHKNKANRLKKSFDKKIKILGM